MNAPALNEARRLQRRIRNWTVLIIVALVFSGLTAIPLETELGWVRQWLGDSTSGFAEWIARVHAGLQDTNQRHPFLAYGTDWLAFTHIVIAIAFVGAWRNPAQSRWLFEFGMIACVLIIPWAFILGGLRGIPMGWRLIDCAFGVGGFGPMWLCWRDACRLGALEKPA